MTEYTKDQIRENRRLWIGALESGDYAQTRDGLARGDSVADMGYCCLGVAAMTVGCAVLQVSPPLFPLDSRFQGFYEGADRYSSLLPQSTREALGFMTDSPRVLWQGRSVALTVLNDEQKWSLAEIAAAIKAQDDDWDGSAVSDMAGPWYSEGEIVPRPVLEVE